MFFFSILFYKSLWVYSLVFSCTRRCFDLSYSSLTCGGVPSGISMCTSWPLLARCSDRMLKYHTWLGDGAGVESILAPSAPPAPPLHMKTNMNSNCIGISLKVMKTQESTTYSTEYGIMCSTLEQIDLWIARSV